VRMRYFMFDECVKGLDFYMMCHLSLTRKKVFYGNAVDNHGA
jgi:hypothetical protein